MNARNLSVDTLRLFAALEVILLHVDLQSLPDAVSIAIRLQARWAVPFFFIVGGYYLGQRLADPARADVRPTIYRMIWVFALWSLIYIPLVIFQHDTKEVFRRLLYPTFLYVGTYFHLWFPSSLALGFIVLLFCFHYKLGKLLPVFSALILLHIFLAGSYDVFGIKFPFDFETARHWVSVPLLALGILLFRRGPLSKPLAASLLIGGFALQAAEAYFLLTRYNVSPYDHEILLGTIPFALGAASLGLSGLKILEQPVLSDWGREYSLGIYLSHALVAFHIGVLAYWISPLAVPAAIQELLRPFILLMTCIAGLAAIRRWDPVLFRWLFGNHIRQE
jgi:surface polysaccharide O-acyltransferase-like enzyme